VIRSGLMLGIITGIGLWQMTHLTNLTLLGYGYPITHIIRKVRSPTLARVRGSHGFLMLPCSQPAEHGSYLAVAIAVID